MNRAMESIRIEREDVPVVGSPAELRYEHGANGEMVAVLHIRNVDLVRGVEVRVGDNVIFASAV